MIIVGILEIIWIFLAVFFLYQKFLTPLQNVITLLITTLISFSTYFLLNNLIGILSLFLTLSIYIYIYTRKKTIFLDICIIIMAGIFSDTITQFFLDLSSNTFIILRMFYFSFFFFVFLIVYNVCRKKVIAANLNTKQHYLLMCLLFLTMLILYINIFILASENLVKVNLFIQIVYLILITLFVYLLLKAKNKERVIHEKEIIHEQFYEYITALSKMNEDMRKVQHDYMNILLSLREYIEENNLEGLKRYFYKNILKDSHENVFKNKIFGSIENLKATELRGIIASKILYADSYKIPVNIEIPEEITELDIEILDFVKVLGIYLDNAIEEEKTVEFPKINIAFLNLSYTETLIIIENKLSRDIPNIDILFQKGYSTKGNNRGLGLTNAIKILNKYKNIICNTRIEKEYFIQEIQINKGNAK